VAAILAGMISAVLASGQGDSVPASSMTVMYHPDAKRPYEPTEPMWSGGPPCSQFPSTGSGTLRLTRSMTPPKLLRKTKADYSRLGPKTRLFAPFLAEYTVSTEGKVTQVRVLRSVSDEFDALVLGELRSSVYDPAKLEGIPVTTCATLVARPHP